MNISLPQKFELWSIDKLKPYERNARTHSAEQIRKIATSILTFGFNSPILVDSKAGVIAGHGRLEAAKTLSMTEVPVIVLDHLSDQEKKAYILADNRIALDAGWNNDMVLAELADLKMDGFTTEAIGFTDAEIERLMSFLPDEELPPLNDTGSSQVQGSTASTTATTETQPAHDPREDEVPEAVEEPKVKPGEVYLLGSHRLLCGDSTSKEDIARLMDGETAEMVFTDPPYRMAVEGGSDQWVGRTAAKLGDAIKHLCDFDPVAFLNSLPTVFSPKTMNCFIFCNKDLVPDYLNWALNSGYAFNILFWKKPNAIPLGGQHRPDVEYLLFFRKSAVWNNGLDGVSYSKCLEFNRENSTPHPTMKPVEMIANQILISSSEGSVVVDFFGGSGSTMIACEKTKRACRMMELEPKYCQIILDRWEQYSGKKAVREDGVLWEDIKKREHAEQEA